MQFRLWGVYLYAALVLAPILAALDYHYRFLLPVLRPLMPILRPLLPPLSGSPILTPFEAICVLTLLYGVPAVLAPAHFRWLIARFRMLLRIELNRIGIVICVSCAYDLRGLEYKASCPECDSPNPPVLPPKNSGILKWPAPVKEVAPRSTMDNIITGWIFLNCTLIWTRVLKLPYQAPQWLIVVMIWLVLVPICYSMYRKKRQAGGPRD
jgi:hypothetical protein